MIGLAEIKIEIVFTFCQIEKEDWYIININDSIM